MKIKRNINGQEIEIELTEAEIRQAHIEEQRECDRSEIRYVLEDLINDAEDDDDAEIFWNQEDCTVGQLRQILADEEAIARMGKALREKLDNHDGISEALRYACEEIISDEIY